MITVYQLPPAFDLPVSVSPYCTRLELYLRLTGLDHRVETGDLRKSPNRKVPFVQWPDGRIQADSGDVIAELEARGPGLDEGLSDADRQIGDKLVALASGPVYFGCLYARFAKENGWQHQRETVRDTVPAILAPILVP